MRKILVFLVSAVIILMVNSLPAMTDMPTEPSAGQASEGTSAPDFILEDLNANKISLSSFKEKKSLILFFWTVSCPFCRKALPTLEKDYLSLRIQDIEILAIDIGESKSRIGMFLKNYPVSFSILLDKDAEVADIYDLYGVPTYILVDKKGIVRYRGHFLPRDYLNLLR
jgi:peroxiredoxin